MADKELANFEFEPQPSQVNGHHILDDVALEIIQESDENNERIEDPHVEDMEDDIHDHHNLDDNNSICTFKSTVTNKSDPLHRFLFSMHHDSSLYSQHQPKKKRKRSFQDMTDESNQNIFETTSIRSISSSSGSDGSRSYHSVSITYNSNKRRKTITKINRNNEDKESNLSLRWDPHIFRGNTAVCLRLKGVYHPAQIHCVTTNYFLVEAQHPDTLRPFFFKFKYQDYIKDKDRVMSMSSASQLTQTQTQSQYINTQQLLLSDANPNEENNESQASELNLYLSDSEDDDDGNDNDNDNKSNANESDKENKAENNEHDDTISDNEVIEVNELQSCDGNIEKNDCDTIGMRVKKMKRKIYCRSESDISSDSENESLASSLFDIELECGLNHNHNGKEIKKRKKSKKKRIESSDEEEDSDAKRTYDDDDDDDENKNNDEDTKKPDGFWTKTKKYVVYWNKAEEAALISGYKKYRKYENRGLFKEGVFSKICKDKKFQKIFAENNRSRSMIRHKWYRLNSKLKLTEKWDKEREKKKKRKKKAKRKRNKNKSHAKSENDDSDSTDY